MRITAIASARRASAIASARRTTTIAFLFFMLSLPLSGAFAQAQTAAPALPLAKNPAYFTIESYYRVKWGYADEFIALWKTNHYPLLKKAQEHGDVISIKAESPRFHSGEETRWDFRVTVTFKNVEKAFDEDLVVPYKKQLFPDLDALGKSEQHRFELLLAHWDIETAEQAL